MFVGLAALLALKLFGLVDASDVFPVALRVPERRRTQLAGDRGRSIVLVPQFVRPERLQGGECLAANVADVPLQGRETDSSYLNFPLSF